MEDIWKTILQLNLEKTPRPNEIHIKFYHSWCIFVRLDVWILAEDIKKGRKFVKDINNNFISLIPKKTECKSFDYFLPVSLWNTTYKIVTKALANTFKKMLEKIISHDQNDFTLHKDITDNKFLTIETLHTISLERLKGMLIKLDVNKAYDRVY